MGLRVAIVGLSPASHDLTPYDGSCEVWGLPWDDYWPRFDRHFEMHDLRLLQSAHSRRKEGYFDRLRDCPKLYMQQGWEHAQAFPKDEVATTTGDYFNSSIAYMMALAIHEGAEWIGLYGVDMKDGEEYGYQKPNLEYLIGLARGKGIEVFIPEVSPLCKFNTSGIRFYNHAPDYVERYGWLG